VELNESVKKDFIDCSLDNKKMGLNYGLTKTFLFIACHGGCDAEIYWGALARNGLKPQLR